MVFVETFGCVFARAAAIILLVPRKVTASDG